MHGRNDTHGHNLHKRVALSLNCIAQLLAQDDEIIFVDWNTPDELPTLIEAIADTLTQACRQHLRILRVRPRQHRRFSQLTHLPVLDAVARNVAIRHCRESSRWLLSTTTDIILAPREQGRRLADIIGPLEPALYHLPRFDLPESLWESVDRQDPVRAIELCASWGSALYLNEIVEANSIVKYDAPGDFQLLPLDLAQQMTGFNEEMVFTYHMDSNLAARASLVVGPVRSLHDDLFLYHCNHYRQGSIHHGPMRAENSWRRFVEQVDQPIVASQTESWGLAGEAIEEVTLPPIGRPRIVAALVAATPANADRLWVTSNGPHSYNRLDYRPEHVVSFVADLLTTLPKDAELGMFSATEGLLRLLAEAWPLLGFVHPILVPDDRLASSQLPIAVAPEAEIVERATTLLFEFGAGPGEDPFASEHSLVRLDEVAESFRHAVARETERALHGRARHQRFLVVNAINTVFERLVADNLAFTYTPFTGRIRYGVVASEPDALATEITSLAKWLALRMGRPPPVPYQEVVDALDLITASLAEGRAPPGLAPVLALFDHPRLAKALGYHPSLWNLLASESRRTRPAVRLAPSLLVRIAEPETAAPPPLSKLAAIEDWNHPNWAAQLLACDEVAASANFFRRHRSTWELVQLCYGATTAAPPSRVRRARVVLPTRHRLAAHLSHIYPCVEVVAAGGARAGRSEEVWPYPGVTYEPARVHVLGGPAAAAEGGPVELVVLPDNAILAHGIGGLASSLELFDGWLAVGGVMVFATEIVIAGGTADDRLPGELVATGAFEALLAEHTGLAPVGGSDWRLSKETLDCLAVAGSPSESQPHFVVQIGNLLSTTAVWVLQKRTLTRPSAWALFAAELAVRVELAEREQARRSMIDDGSIRCLPHHSC